MTFKPKQDGDKWVIAEVSPTQSPNGDDTVIGYLCANGSLSDPKQALRFATYEEAEDKINDA